MATRGTASETKGFEKNHTNFKGFRVRVRKITFMLRVLSITAMVSITRIVLVSITGTVWYECFIHVLILQI